MPARSSSWPSGATRAPPPRTEQRFRLFKLELLASNIGAGVRLARQAAQLTQAEVAERVKMTPQAFAGLERGRILPNATVLRELCLVLGASADASICEKRIGEVGALSELAALVRQARDLPPRQVRPLGVIAYDLVA